MRVRGDGPIPARVLLLGEFPSEQDVRTEACFTGEAGIELNRLLHEAGLLRSECYTTLVVKTRPQGGTIDALFAPSLKEVTPQHIKTLGRYVTPVVIKSLEELQAELALVQPNIIIAFGNIAMWALTGEWNVIKWRGSMMTSLGGIKVIPTHHPSALFKQWELRGLIVNDLRRAKNNLATKQWENKPVWRFKIQPVYSDVAAIFYDLMRALEQGTVWLDLDIETRVGHIDCIGLSWSKTEGLCIPLMDGTSTKHYWLEEEETAIVFGLYKILTNPNAKIRWQNGLYDAQYIYRWWHFIPRGVQDTMISQHSLYAALPKSLAFLASMYCEWYCYWKEEGKVAENVPPSQRWRYNLQDCVYTREVGEKLSELTNLMGLAEVEQAQQALFYPVLRAMLRGVKMRPEIKAQMEIDIQTELTAREQFLYDVLGHTINPSSPKQMQALFYDDLGQPPILKRTIKDGRYKMSPSCDDEALAKIVAREKLLRPICNAIADIRTLKKFIGDFVQMPLDSDGRMRCAFNIAGDAAGKSAPYSYRLSSSKNAFDSGGNLQTIPSEKSKSAGKAAARGSMNFTLPNIRTMYGPDEGYTFFDMDLDRADLQVVVEESGEAEWKAAMRMGVDMHLLNAFMLDAREPPALDELVELHPNYKEHRSPLRHAREFAKVFCHATNYGAQAPTVAAHTGKTVHAVDVAQKRWFEMHPGIREWHDRTAEQIKRYRFVENKWGYRWYIFDRLDKLLPEALAWVPQSTVGILINRIWLNLHDKLPEVEILLQVHDSLAGQFKTADTERLLPLISQHSRIAVPYPDPLYIPTGIKTSVISWGDCE